MSADYPTVQQRRTNRSTDHIQKVINFNIKITPRQNYNLCRIFPEPFVNVTYKFYIDLVLFQQQTSKKHFRSDVGDRVGLCTYTKFSHLFHSSCRIFSTGSVMICDSSSSSTGSCGSSSSSVGSVSPCSSSSWPSSSSAYTKYSFTNWVHWSAVARPFKFALFMVYRVSAKASLASSAIPD